MTLPNLIFMLSLVGASLQIGGSAEINTNLRSLEECPNEALDLKGYDVTALEPEYIGEYPDSVTSTKFSWIVKENGIPPKDISHWKLRLPDCFCGKNGYREDDLTPYFDDCWQPDPNNSEDDFEYKNKNPCELKFNGKIKDNCQSATFSVTFPGCIGYGGEEQVGVKAGRKTDWGKICAPECKCRTPEPTPLPTPSPIKTPEPKVPCDDKPRKYITFSDGEVVRNNLQLKDPNEPQSILIGPVAGWVTDNLYVNISVSAGEYKEYNADNRNMIIGGDMFQINFLPTTNPLAETVRLKIEFIQKNQFGFYFPIDIKNTSLLMLDIDQPCSNGGACIEDLTKSYSCTRQEEVKFLPPGGVYVQKGSKVCQFHEDTFTSTKFINYQNNVDTSPDNTASREISVEREYIDVSKIEFEWRFLDLKSQGNGRNLILALGIQDCPLEEI